MSVIIQQLVDCSFVRQNALEVERERAAKVAALPKPIPDDIDVDSIPKREYKHFPSSAQPVWRSGRAKDSGSRGPGLETPLCHLVFPLCKEINRHC